MLTVIYVYAYLSVYICRINWQERHLDYCMCDGIGVSYVNHSKPARTLTLPSEASSWSNPSPAVGYRQPAMMTRPLHRTYNNRGAILANGSHLPGCTLMLYNTPPCAPWLCLVVTTLDIVTLNTGDMDLKFGLFSFVQVWYPSPLTFPC